jgi:hypothetical protein
MHVCIIPLYRNKRKFLFFWEYLFLII